MGHVIVKCVSFALLLTLAEGASLPAGAEHEECLVQSSIVTEPPTQPVFVVAYVTRKSAVILDFKFHEHAYKEDRDSVQLNSTNITHYIVRNGTSTPYRQNLPILVPEGCNIFRVTLAARNLTITLVLHSSQVHLTTLHLDYHVQEMYIQGNNQQIVKLCSTLPTLPAWEGGAGEQPAGSQWHAASPSGTAWPTAAIVVVAVLVVAAVGVLIGVKCGPRLKERFCTNTNDNTEAHHENSNTLPVAAWRYIQEPTFLCAVTDCKLVKGKKPSEHPHERRERLADVSFYQKGTTVKSPNAAAS